MDDLAELKVLIADDEPLAAERLQLLLARCDGIDLVGSASDGVMGAARGWLVGNLVAAAVAGASLAAELRTMLPTGEDAEPILVPRELDVVVGS